MLAQLNFSLTVLQRIGI